MSMHGLVALRLVWAAGVIGIIAFAASGGLVRAHEGHAALPSTGATVDGDLLLLSPGAQKAIGLQTAKVTLGRLQRVLRVSARAELPWNQQAMVTTLAAGRVERVLVKPGEAVTAGQELARIESLEQQALQLEMLDAAAEAELAEKIVQQRRALAMTGSVSGQLLLESEAVLRQATLRFQMALHKLRALGLSDEVLREIRSTGQAVETISVTSPISGVVLHADVGVGQFVETTQHLFNIVDDARLQIVGEVLETDAAEVHPGDPVEVTFAALPGNTFRGQVDRLQLTLDEARRTIGAVVAIDNADDRLRAGMFGRMAITTHSVEQAVVCPAGALIEAGNQTFVLLRQGDGKFQRKAVELGLRTSGQVEVLQGLFPGHQVIVVGTQLLASLFPSPRDGSPSAASPTGGVPSSDPDRSAKQVINASAAVEIPTDRQAVAVSALEGRIASIHVRPGEPVRRGQLLAELDSQELRTLQLDLLQSQQKRRLAQEHLRRIEPLAEREVVTRSRLWQSQTEEQLLTQRVESLAGQLAMVGLSAAQIQDLRQRELAGPGELEFLTVPVRAPIDGQVADFDIVPGQVVRRDVPLFEIQDLSTVWIKAFIAERDVAGLKVGQPGHVTFGAFKNLQLTGPLVRVAPMLHRDARVLPVWIEVENPAGHLRGGMFARVKLVQPHGAAVAARTVEP